MNGYLLIPVVVILLGGFIFVRWWYSRGREMFRFIKTPEPIPSRELPAEFFESLTPVAAVVKLTPLEEQPQSGDMRCTAYTWHEIAQTVRPDKQMPDVETFFRELSKMDDSGGDPHAAGTDPKCAVKWLQRKGFIKRYFNFKAGDFASMKAYLRAYGPFGLAVRMPLSMVIDEVTDPARGMIRGRVISWDGYGGMNHAIVCFGYDEEFPCADGTRGAFRVRWHFREQGWCDGDGWVPFSVVTPDRLIENLCYGYLLD